MKRNTIYPYMNTPDAYNKCNKRNKKGINKGKCKSSNVFFKLNFFIND